MGSQLTNKNGEWLRSDLNIPAWFMEEIVTHASNGPVLEVGCASGNACRKIQSRTGCLAVGVDVKSEFLSAGAHDFLTNGDATSLPFKDDTFELVFSVEMIEHLPSKEDQLSFFNEVARVLSPGGLLFLKTPNKYQHDAFKLFSGELKSSRDYHPSVLAHSDLQDLVQGVFEIEYYDTTLLPNQQSKVNDKLPGVGTFLSKIPFKFLPKPLQPSICANLRPQTAESKNQD